MRKAFLLSLSIVLGIITAKAQVQQGFVRTLERPDHPSQSLSGVTIRVRGGHNAVVSGGDGRFSVTMMGKRNGDAYVLQQVQKQGYEVNETGFIGRQLAFSDRVPLTIVMVNTAQLQADKQRIENNAYRVAERNYHTRMAQLEEQLAAQTISAEQYREQLHSLQESFEKYQQMIDGLADHYAHTDYDGLSDKEREINILIENGELERADSLLSTLFDPVGVIERNRQALAGLDQQIADARNLIDEANTQLAAVLRQQERDAEHLYQLYTIALAQFDNDKARQYIETRAALDTTNVEWQMQAGQYVFEYLADYDLAMNYFQRMLHQSQLQFGEQAERTSAAYNDLGMCYYAIGDYAQSLEYFQKALEILKAVTVGLHFEIATGYNNKGLAYYAQGDYVQALDNYRQAMEVYKATLGEQHPNVATSYNNIGTVYYAQKDYARALECYQKALEIEMAILSEHNPHIATSYNNIGLAYFELDNNAKALESHQRALEIRKTVLGEQHPEVAKSYNNIGLVYGANGDYVQALEYYQKALEILLPIVGEQHPDVKTIQQNILLAQFELYLMCLPKLYHNLTDSIAQGTNITENMENLRELLRECCFTATIIDGDTPASQQGMSGEYCLLEFADWTQDSTTSLFAKNEELRGQPKDILVMKDGVISRHHFENTIGARFNITYVGSEEKQRINEAYRRWKGQ